MTHGWYLGQLGEQDSGRVELRATQQVCHVRIYSLHDKEEDHRYQTDIMSSGVQISYPDPQIHRWYHGSMVLVWYLPIWGMDGYPPMASLGCKMVVMLYYVCVLCSMPCIYRAYSTSTLYMLQYFTYFHTLLHWTSTCGSMVDTMTHEISNPSMTSRGRDLRITCLG